MLKQENKRTVTVTCLGTMSNDEAMDILATYIAKKIYEKRYGKNPKENERRCEEWKKYKKYSQKL